MWLSAFHPTEGRAIKNIWFDSLVCVQQMKGKTKPVIKIVTGLIPNGILP